MQFIGDRIAVPGKLGTDIPGSDFILMFPDMLRLGIIYDWELFDYTIKLLKINWDTLYPETKDDAIKIMCCYPFIYGMNWDKVLEYLKYLLKDYEMGFEDHGGHFTNLWILLLFISPKQIQNLKGEEPYIRQIKGAYQDKNYKPLKQYHQFLGGKFPYRKLHREVKQWLTILKGIGNKLAPLSHIDVYLIAAIDNLQLLKQNPQLLPGWSTRIIIDTYFSSQIFDYILTNYSKDIHVDADNLIYKIYTDFAGTMVLYYYLDQNQKKEFLEELYWIENLPNPEDVILTLKQNELAT